MYLYLYFAAWIPGLNCSNKSSSDYLILTPGSDNHIPSQGSRNVTHQYFHVSLPLGINCRRHYMIFIPNQLIRCRISWIQFHLLVRDLIDPRPHLSEFDSGVSDWLSDEKWHLQDVSMWVMWCLLLTHLFGGLKGIDFPLLLHQSVHLSHHRESGQERITVAWSLYLWYYCVATDMLCLSALFTNTVSHA